jgi:dienelactone hydrolase
MANIVVAHAMGSLHTASRTALGRLMPVVLAALPALVLAQQQAEVSIVSRDVFTVDGLRVEHPKEVTVPGRLALPGGPGPFPAVVVVNSSAGTEDRIWSRLMADLPAQGFAALGIQTFVGRGIRGGVDSNQGEVSFLAAPVDALHALRYLRTRPDIDPKRICVIGHSRGGQAAFNFLYFKSFHQLAGVGEEPFACNISINTGGHYRPASLEATGKPALVFIGERDDVWHMDVYRAFVEEVRNAGNPVEIHVLKNSYHSLTAERVYCPQAQQVRACREQVVYTDKGLLVQGRLSTQKKGWRTCGRWGYHCGYGNMELYDDMYTVVVDFLRRAVGSTK